MKHRVLLFLCTTALAAHAVAAEKPEAKESTAPPPEKATARAKLYSLDLSGRDLRFLTDALEFGLEQVFLCELGRTRTENEQLKGFADVVTPTQQEENSKLARLAALKGLTLVMKEPAAQKKLLKKFEKLGGAKFEKVWVGEIIALNQRAVGNYESALKSSDPDIKGFVESALPLAKEKLQLAHKITGTAPPPAKGSSFQTGTPVPAPR